MNTPRRSLSIAALYALVPLALAGPAPTSGHAAPEPPGSPELNDAEIAHVAVTANAIDVEMARLAVSRASDPDVLRFARTMIEDHTAVNERAAKLVERLGVKPEPNEVSRSLREDAEAAREKLQDLNGASFDRAYIEREVTYHQAVLDALDELLIPGAENAELRSLLQEVRPAIAAHLESARAIRGSLASNR